MQLSEPTAVGNEETYIADLHWWDACLCEDGVNIGVVPLTNVNRRYKSDSLPQVGISESLSFWSNMQSELLKNLRNFLDPSFQSGENKACRIIFVTNCFNFWLTVKEKFHDT